MTAQLIDGKALAVKVRDGLKEEAQAIAHMESRENAERSAELRDARTAMATLQGKNAAAEGASISLHFPAAIPVSER